MSASTAPNAQPPLPPLADLQARYAGASADAILRDVVQRFAGEVAAVSSFGAESVVLLHQLAQLDPGVPVIFLNTGKLFGETLRYRDRVQTMLGLADVRSTAPLARDVQRRDPKGDLWNRAPDQCCHMRKVLPQERALKDFRVILTGRKRFQTQDRWQMEMIEEERGAEGEQRYRINPLAPWTIKDLGAYIETHKLPRHPLTQEGFQSIGCMPCTRRVREGEDYRAGRWAGRDKDECGIHGTEFADGEGI